jgi:signal transduction histidine kinase
MMLANRLPMLLWWGPQYVSIYNDPYIPVLGNKHPWALGQPVSECWKEIWHVLKPLIDTPFHGGPATWDEDILFVIKHHEFAEETHWLIAYSPVPDDTVPGKIGSVLATVHEATEKVVGQRRMVALRDLGTRPAEAKTAEEACAVAARMLEAHAEDTPFALLYLTEGGGRHARLAATAGVAPGQDISPELVDLDGNEGRGWPLSEAKRTMRSQVVADLGARFTAVPPGPWPDPPATAVVLPVRSITARELAGFLVAGVSSRLRLDDAYMGFLDLAAAQIANAVGNARAHEEERRRAQALAELDRAKTAFFSNVSHEFRTPLTLMLGPVEEVLARPDLPDTAAAQLEVVNRNWLRLLRLVNSLLDFSRIEAGRVKAAFEPTDLADFTAELASNFRSACERAGLSLTVDCPPVGEPVFVDRPMWGKVVLNLLSNVFKYTLEGGIAVGVRRGAAGRSRRRGPGAGHRDGHPDRGDAEAVRAVPPGRERPGADARGERHRAGAGPGVGPAPRRDDHRRERGRGGHDVHRDPPARVGPHAPPSKSAAAPPPRSRPWRRPSWRRRCGGCRTPEVPKGGRTSRRRMRSSPRPGGRLTTSPGCWWRTTTPTCDATS